MEITETHVDVAKVIALMSSSSKTQRPGKRTFVGDRMKLHLRTVRGGHVVLRLVTLRPHTEAAFSTNYFHDTWHILSNQRGAQLLARLMWGLSFQRDRDTVVLIHGEQIRPTPFEADRSDPILLMLAGGSEKDLRVLRSLQDRLGRLGHSQRTVRWHTFGLDLALERAARRQPGDWTWESHDDDWLYYDDSKSLWDSERMSRRSGFVCYSAPPRIMRQRALSIARLNVCSYGMDYCYLADNNEAHWAEGEVQIFSDYLDRCAAAAAARRRVANEARCFADRDSWYAVVAARRDQILRQRRAAVGEALS